ncbi:MAG TPA: hypothetical protein VN754_06970 [Candidatus Binataceae bacterium]|nr:hypothetical protein [Candidatus Binataceae bacterium]
MVRMTAGTVLLAATVAASALTQATYVRAATKYDGAWSVVIYTRTGPCDAAYRFSGQITNGIITYTGGPVDFTGRVRSGGAAYVRVSSGSNYAVAHGRLAVRRGSGVWHGQGPNGYCTGTWSATRA